MTLTKTIEVIEKPPEPTVCPEFRIEDGIKRYFNHIALDSEYMRITIEFNLPEAYREAQNPVVEILGNFTSW